MKLQRRFAPIGGLFKPESVAGLARMRTPFKKRFISRFRRLKRLRGKMNFILRKKKELCH
jgi:hypothetical protein